MQSEFQLQYVGKCRECGTACYHDEDEDRNVWVPGSDCLHRLPREDMWRVICRHGLTEAEVQAYKIDILAEHDMDTVSPDQFEAIVFALSKDSFMVKVVEHD